MTSSSIDPISLNDLACWRVRVGNNELLVSQQGAQILSCTLAGQPLIWLSERAAFDRGQPVRGGVPICWPWFGNLPTNPQPVQDMYEQPENAPAHGLIRGLDWQLEDAQALDGKAQLSFVYNTRKNPLKHWPYTAEVRFNILLDECLHMELITRNLDSRDLHFSQALHSYFAVSDIEQVHIEGLESCDYLDCLDGWSQKRQTDSIRFNGETDRVYINTTESLSITDPHWQRRIRLKSSGSQSAVVWNPWTEKALRLSQFAPDAWRNMLCIEHANAASNSLTLAAGEQHSLKVSLQSEQIK